MVDVPTKFIVFNGERMDWDRFFDAWLDIREMESTPRPAFDFYEKWVDRWEKRGVIGKFMGEWTNKRGETFIVPMLTTGPGYKEFTAAVEAFNANQKAERKRAIESESPEPALADLAAGIL